MQVQELPDNQDPGVAVISTLVGEADRGDPEAVGALFTALYAELHRVAKWELSKRGLVAGGLGTTTLLHEAYLSMAQREASAFPDKARFMRYAARAMRGLVVDHVRSRRAYKRGGEFHITSLGTENPVGPAESLEITRISEALDELAAVDSDLAHLVELKFFCGCSFDEIAAMQDVSKRTVQRQWEKARIFLHDCIRSATSS